MQNNDVCSIKPIEHAAGRFDNLPVAGSLSQLDGSISAFRVVAELFDVGKNAPDQFRSCLRVLKGDVVRNGVKICERRLRPDYFNHRPRRAFAPA